MEISDSKKDRISELISDKDVKIIGDVVIAFPHKKPLKSFFRDHMEVDEKNWMDGRRLDVESFSK